MYIVDTLYTNVRNLEVEGVHVDGKAKWSGEGGERDESGEGVIV